MTDQGLIVHLSAMAIPLMIVLFLVVTTSGCKRMLMIL